MSVNSRATVNAHVKYGQAVSLISQRAQCQNQRLLSPQLV